MGRAGDNESRDLRLELLETIEIVYEANKIAHEKIQAALAHTEKVREKLHQEGKLCWVDQI